jgi:hypothetical protein
MAEPRKPTARRRSKIEDAAWQRALDYGRRKRVELFGDLDDDELDQRITAIVETYRRGRPHSS